MSLVYLPDLQNEGQPGEFQVGSLHVPSKKTLSPGFRVTVGPARQSEVFVQTELSQPNLSLVEFKLSTVLHPVAQQALDVASGKHGESVLSPPDGS